MIMSLFEFRFRPGFILFVQVKEVIFKSLAAEKAHDNCTVEWD